MSSTVRDGAPDRRVESATIPTSDASNNIPVLIVLTASLLPLSHVHEGSKPLAPQTAGRRRRHRRHHRRRRELPNFTTYAVLMLSAIATRNKTRPSPCWPPV